MAQEAVRARLLDLRRGAEAVSAADLRPEAAAAAAAGGTVSSVPRDPAVGPLAAEKLGIGVGASSAAAAAAAALATSSSDNAL